MSVTLVSAIITTHNRSALLRRAIKSVLSQTYEAIECIVVDDNSDDDTAEVCSAFDKVQYIHIGADESRGGNYARNKGIKASKGMYVAFLDDDDYWLPEKIKKQVALSQESKAGVIYCARRNKIINTDVRVDYKDTRPNQYYKGDMREKIFTHIPATTSTLLVEKAKIEEIGGFDEDLRFWQEFDLLIRLSEVAEFDFVDEPLIVYRIDKTDVQRLTNKYEPWTQAVKYIQKKYSRRIGELRYADKLKMHRLIASDSLLRSQSTNKYKQMSAWLIYRWYVLLVKLFE